MNTGSLKFVSLLVVIGVGGGVVWQIQQRLKETRIETADTAGDDSADAADEEPPPIEGDFAEPPEFSEEPPRRLASADWNDPASDDVNPDDADSEESPPAAPGKFERKLPERKSRDTAIPPRRSSRRGAETERDAGSPPELVDQTGTEFSGDDPFGEQADPAATDSDRPTFAGNEDSFPATDAARDAGAEDASEPDHLLASEAADETVRDSDKTDAAGSDPFDDAAPVMLVGKHEKEPPSKLEFQSESAAESEDDAPAEMDDPFAGSAPPEFGDDPVEETPPKKPARAAPTASEEPKEVLAPERDSKTEPQPIPSRRRAAENSLPLPKSNPALPTEIEPFPEEQPDSSPEEEPDAEPGLPAATVDESPRPRRRSVADEPEEAGPRSRRLPTAAEEESPPEDSPRLLPVPESMKKPGSLPPRETETDPGFLDGIPTPERDMQPTAEESLFDNNEISGDGTPDRDAPKGLQQPRLTIEKIAPKQAVLGQPLIYSVVVKNIGTAEARQVTIEDRIPKGTRLEGTAPRAELIDKKLVWRLGTLKPDEQRKISIKVIPQEQGPIGSVARVNFVAEIAAEIEVTAPQLSVSVDAASQVRLGEKLHLVFKVRNTGGADAQNVVVRNLIPDGLRHPAGNDLEYAMGTLPAQQTREIKLDLVAVKNGKATNKTVITADGGINVEEETPFEVIGEELLLTRTGKNRLFVDKPAVFTSTVVNEGTAPAPKVMVAEVVPAGLEFVSASDNGKYDPTTRAVTWSIGPIGPGEEMKLSTKLMPKELGEYRATVTVTGPAGGVATVDAELKVDGFPAVSVESKSDSRLISVGEKATIRIHCKNQGTAATKNLILSAELPPELKLLNGKGPTAWGQQGNVIAFEAIPSVDPDETATYEIQVEGIAEGDTRIDVQLSADHLKRPLHRDEPIRVTP